MSQATDASGNGHHGSLQNGPNWVPENGGGTFDFDGVDDYIDAGDISAAEGLSEVSVSAWVRTDDDSRDAVLVSKGPVALNTVWVLWQDNHDPGSFHFVKS